MGLLVAFLSHDALLYFLTCEGLGTCGAYAPGLEEATTWHLNGSGGGLELGSELKGFPERGWKSALSPCGWISESMHATLLLALDVPEAGGLVWVVDGQADSSNVL